MLNFSTTSTSFTISTNFHSLASLQRLRNLGDLERVFGTDQFYSVLDQAALWRQRDGYANEMVHSIPFDGYGAHTSRFLSESPICVTLVRFIQAWTQDQVFKAERDCDMPESPVSVSSLLSGNRSQQLVD